MKQATNNTATNNTATNNEGKAFIALDKFADSRVALIQAMHDLGYSELDKCKGIVIKWACIKTGASWNESKAGKIMLDSKSEKYESAKSVVRDVMAMVEGTTRHEKRKASSAKKEVSFTANADGKAADELTAQVVAELFKQLSAEQQAEFVRIVSGK